MDVIITALIGSNPTLIIAVAGLIVFLYLIGGDKPKAKPHKR